jgi:hypothetical protein
VATPSQKMASTTHRRRSLPGGLIRVEVRVRHGDAGLIRALAETLRGNPARAKTLRSTLEQALLDPQVKTAFDIFGSISKVDLSPFLLELKRRRDAEQAAALDRWFAQMRTRLGDRVLPVDEPIVEAWALLSVLDPSPLIDGLLAATAKVHGLRRRLWRRRKPKLSRPVGVRMKLVAGRLLPSCRPRSRAQGSCGRTYSQRYRPPPYCSQDHSAAQQGAHQIRVPPALRRVRLPLC